MKRLLAILLPLLLVGGCGIYSFSGTSIQPDVKSITINYIEYRALRVNPSLSASLQPGGFWKNGLHFSSDNPAVATVNAAGKVTAVRSGETIIRVEETGSGLSAQCRVRVSPATLTLKKTELTDEQTDSLSQVFKSQMPKMEKTEFSVEVQSLGEQSQPVLITQSEYMRRMKDMSRFQSGMGFYAQMPDMYSMVLNADHELVKKVLSDTENATSEALKPILAELKGQEARLAAIQQAQDKKKYDELTQEDKDQKAEAEKAVNEQKDKKTAVLADYAAGNSIVHQLIDLALLQNGMLKGAALDSFLKRSVEMIQH